MDITPNRADACSHYGVARDLYAYRVVTGFKDDFDPETHEAIKVPVYDKRAIKMVDQLYKATSGF